MDSASALSRDRDSHPAALLRAGIAVLVLYAFVLQAFLGGLMPLPASADGLCAQHAASDSAPDRPAQKAHGTCCTAAHASGAALPPRPDQAAITWPAMSDARAAGGTLARHRPRAPPDRSASPRGPPSA
jgi:hypothetical protein